MSVNCIIQNCALNCCNVTGYCPSSFSGCYYYYNDYIPTVLSVGAIIGIVIGGIIVLGFSIAFIVFLCRRCKHRRRYLNRPGAQITVISTGAPATPVYGYNQQAFGYSQQQQMVYGEPMYPKESFDTGRPYTNQPFNQPYNPMTNQPPVGQPLVS